MVCKPIGLREESVALIHLITSTPHSQLVSRDLTMADVVAGEEAAGDGIYQSLHFFVCL